MIWIYIKTYLYNNRTNPNGHGIDITGLESSEDSDVDNSSLMVGSADDGYDIDGIDDSFVSSNDPRDYYE